MKQEYNKNPIYRVLYLFIGFYRFVGTVFIGYMGYYLVRNNITLSTPFIQNQLNLSKSDIGTITGSMLIAYGISKGAMSVISDKADPKNTWL
ncbi:hypothetical protein ACISBX_08745 [Campylobacter jejuni]